MLHTFSPGAYVCALEKSTEGRLPYLRRLAAGLIRGRTTVKERACIQAACARKVSFPHKNGWRLGGPPKVVGRAQDLTADA